MAVMPYMQLAHLEEANTGDRGHLDLMICSSRFPATQENIISSYF